MLGTAYLEGARLYERAGQRERALVLVSHRIDALRRGAGHARRGGARARATAEAAMTISDDRAIDAIAIAS